MRPDLPAAQIRRFHDVLAGSGYSEQGLIDTLGPIQLPTRRLQERAYFRYLTRRGRPLDTQIRLFLASLPVTPEEAREGLKPVPLEDWVEAGLVGIEGGLARGQVRMMAYRHLLLACDQLELQGTAAPPDAVMGITASTSTLAESMIDLPSRATLDLGTGSGVLALIASRWSEHTWAVDLAGRSIRYARFNAALNGIGDCVEFLEGNAFEPVAERKFDLIVSNPPFAMNPSRRYLYRDSGFEADGFVHDLISKAPAFLNEGGYCQMLGQWAHVAGQDWKDRLGGWLEGSGCDAWVMVTNTDKAADDARSWVRDTENADADESDRLLEEWLASYERQAIEAVSTGLITLRKTGSAPKKNWIRFDDAPTTSGLFGRALVEGFARTDFLATLTSDEALLASRLKVASSACLDHVCEWEDSSWRIRSARLRLEEGLQFQANLDLRLAGMIALCDGKATLGDVLARTAAALHVEVERLAPQCLTITRRLIEQGYLLPAE